MLIVGVRSGFSETQCIFHWWLPNCNVWPYSGIFPIAVTFATYMQSTYRNRVKEIREYGYRCGSQPKSIDHFLKYLFQNLGYPLSNYFHDNHL